VTFLKIYVKYPAFVVQSPCMSAQECYTTYDRGTIRSLVRVIQWRSWLRAIECTGAMYFIPFLGLQTLYKAILPAE
jgi:hypothetical protein